MSKSNITKPLQDVYYILKNGNIHYGMVCTNQVLNSNMETMITFTDEMEWVTELINLGISEQNLIDEGYI